MTSTPASQWREVEIALTGPAVANSYTDVDASVIFTHDRGRQLLRPMFWESTRSF
jgi:hypothetical protein